jgi:hypothetical protein
MVFRLRLLGAALLETAAEKGPFAFLLTPCLELFRSARLLRVLAERAFGDAVAASS